MSNVVDYILEYLIIVLIISIHYTLLVGNILCLAGFGNLQGNLEFWDMAQKKLISSVSAKDATCFMWSPDGQHALTATLSPRMRVGNG